MKYVVDIPESMVIKSALKGLTLGITMKVPSNNQDFVIPTNIQLEPYTEPNIYSHTDNPTGWELYQDYQKAKERYETWKKQKDEIHVGDEIKFDIGNNNDMKAVALDQTGLNGEWSVLTENGCVEEHDEEELYKTGKHFDDVAELLEKMRGEE